MSSPPPKLLRFDASAEVWVGPGLVLSSGATAAAGVTVNGDLLASSLEVNGKKMADEIAAIAGSSGVGAAVPVDLATHVKDSSVGPSRLTLVGLADGGTGEAYDAANAGRVTDTPGTGSSPANSPLAMVWNNAAGSLSLGADFRVGGVELSGMF